MNLRTRLLSQSLIVLITTIIITVCAGSVYGYFSAKMNRDTLTRSAADMDVIVMREGNVLYASGGFGTKQAKELQMNAEMNNWKYTYDGVKYQFTIEPFQKDGTAYELVKLTPLDDLSAYYQKLIAFVIGVFLITFLLASLISQRYYERDIIHPMVRLKQETVKLSEGDLDTEIVDDGYGEVRDLCEAVEQLRLKLKESVFYQEKYDENRKFLVSSISHDLKTPVTAIRGYIEGILDGVAATDEKREKYLQTAWNKTNLVSTMIDDLLLYSKLDLNQIPFSMGKVDIAGYIRDFVEDNIFGFEKEGKSISLENQIGQDVLITIDGERFGRVVQNVLDNARKHIDPGTGHVTVVVRETPAAVIIEVQDNGDGIKKEDLPHIFDRFYRADSARKVEGSSGLGLAIAKQIVEGMDGRIWALSEPGEGTSILISFNKSRRQA